MPTIINIPIPKNEIQEEEIVHVYPSYPFQYQPAEPQFYSATPRYSYQYP